MLARACVGATSEQLADAIISRAESTVRSIAQRHVSAATHRPGPSAGPALYSAHKTPILKLLPTQGSTMAFERLRSNLRRAADGRDYGVRE